MTQPDPRRPTESERIDAVVAALGVTRHEARAALEGARWDVWTAIDYLRRTAKCR